MTVTTSRRRTDTPARTDARPNTALTLQRATAAATAKELSAALTSWLDGHRGVLAAGHVRPSTGGDSADGPVEPLTHTFEGPAFDHVDWHTSVDAASAAAIASGSPASVPVEGVRNLTVQAVPSATSDAPAAAFVAATSDINSAAAIESALLAAAATESQWFTTTAAARDRRRLALAAATLDLTTLVSGSIDGRTAAVRLVNALAEHLGCRAVILGLTKRSRCRVAACSGVATADAQSAHVARIEECLDESARRARPAVVPAEDPGNRDGLLCHEKLRRRLDAIAVLSHPLIGLDDQSVGSLVLVYDETPDTAEGRELLAACCGPVAAALRAVTRGRSRSNSPRSVVKRLGIAAAVVAAFVGVMFVPVPHAVTCPCETQPTVRRFVVAPFEGLLENSFVAPGDRVTAGQLLARMDGRDIRSELAGLQAEASRAAKEIDVQLVSGDAAAAQQAELELARTRSQIAVLTRQQSDLDVTAPIDGVVLEGDLERVQNAPVSLGQSLYEVAPLDELVVEVALPAEDFAYFPDGSPVAVRLDGQDADCAGRVRRRHPQSEVRDGRNVFVAEVRVTNDDDRLRPGMAGFARVSGEDKLLGWTLFHRPWEELRAALPFGW